jgi:dihydrolipoamide dehydrogenase
VNARLETGIEGVYAVGDALGPVRPMLAHVASMEGVAAAANALGGNVTPEYGAVPYAVYSIPETAGVGLSETAARKMHPVVRTQTVHMRAIGRAQTSGFIAGFVKIVADGSGRILGIHIVGSNAAELVAEGTLAVRMGMKVADLASTVHAHPTFSEAVWEAARAFMEGRSGRMRSS